MSCVSRFGWIGRKVGMTNIQRNDQVIAVTLVEVFKQNIISKFNKNGDFIIKIGVECNKLKKKPQLIELQKLNKPLCSIVKEFKVTEDEYNSVENFYDVNLVENESFLDITSNSIGKGFAGGMKLWNFQGAGASHGTSLTHRAIGSTGTRDKNWKGKKMPGRMGNETITMQNIAVCEIDKELNLVALYGTVPGKAGGIVVLRKAIKKQSVGGVS